MDTPNSTPTTTAPGGKGSLIGSIIVVLIIIIGGAYLLLNRSANAPVVPESATSTIPTTTTAPGETGFQTSSASSNDDIASLKADADALSTTEVDQATTNLDTEVNAK